MFRSSKSRILTGLCTVAAVLLLASCSGSESSSPAETTVATTASKTTEFSGYVRSPAADVSSVELPTVDGKSLKMVAEPDGLLIVFFGYALCPDICPLTLKVLETALDNQSESDQERVQVAMVTVDPARDDNEVLADYVKGYFPSGIGIRIEDPTELRTAADEFGADYSSRINAEGKREVTHSAELYVIDDTGTVILAWPFGVTPEAITADLKRLLVGERPTAGA